MKAELPDVKIIRNRIKKASPQEAKYALMSAYLFCGRASEIISRKCPSDLHTTARGLKGSDLDFDNFAIGDINEEAAIFTLRTAKRGGKIRKIALPLNQKYEPFTKELVGYYEKFGNTPVFNFTRQVLYNYASELFRGLTYYIEAYTFKDSTGNKTPIKPHHKPFATHALRHLRASELMEYYGFSGLSLSIYGGWTLRSMIGVGSSMSRYAHLRWQQYFGKLLKTRRD